MEEKTLKDHISLVIHEESPKPLITREEAEAMAKPAVLKAVEQEIKRLTETENINQQILQAINSQQETLQTIKEYILQPDPTRQLKLEVLQKLKAKLETT